ncbi:MAG TPA: hypothetical protein PKB03_01910, partial [Baekduia sp.]|nr:hypothetical protein [Baekduia sp.]
GLPRHACLRHASGVSEPPPREEVGLARFPRELGGAVVLGFVDSSVEIMLVWRGGLRSVSIPDTAWQVSGAYVLLGSVSKEGAQAGKIIRARPGLARTNLLRRVGQHFASPDLIWSQRALLIRDTTGFNSAQAGFLEGLLHERCRAAPRVEHDFRRDHDTSLKSHEQGELRERYLAPVLATLDLVGVDLTGEEGGSGH